MTRICVVIIGQKAAEDSRTQTITDRRQLALLFSYSINYEYDSRHGLIFHLLRQNTSDTHMGCTTLNSFISNGGGIVSKFGLGVYTSFKFAPRATDFGSGTALTCPKEAI